MYLQPASVAIEPCPYFVVLVVGSVVLHQDGAAAAVMLSKFIKKPEVRYCVEDDVLFVVELRAEDINSSKNLHALTFSGHWDFRRAPDRAPCGVER